MNDNIIRERALAELTQFEAAAFRFGHQVRAFLAAFPEDMPSPVAVLPRFASETTRNGEWVVGATSYVHLVVSTAAEVDTWAAQMQTPVKRNVTEKQAYCSVSTSAEGTVDGLRVYVGSSETYSPTQWQQMQEDSAGPDGEAG